MVIVWRCDAFSSDRRRPMSASSSLGESSVLKRIRSGRRDEISSIASLTELTMTRSAPTRLANIRRRTSACTSSGLTTRTVLTSASQHQHEQDDRRDEKREEKRIVGCVIRSDRHRRVRGVLYRPERFTSLHARRQLCEALVHAGVDRHDHAEQHRQHGKCGRQISYFFQHSFLTYRKRRALFAVRR